MPNSLDQEKSGETCTLCGNARAAPFAQANNRNYLRCAICHLVVVCKEQLPTPGQEHAEYDMHNNNPHDPRYRAHLEKLTVPLMQGLPVNATGLDFGSGPGPAISVMLAEQGFMVSNYDPAYAPDKQALDSPYDFITCTEVAEHFHNPGKEFALLAKLLNPGGRLGLMTRLLSTDVDFETWYYPREISHVAFYATQTMAWIARCYSWQLEIIMPDVVIFQDRR